MSSLTGASSPSNSGFANFGVPRIIAALQDALDEPNLELPLLPAAAGEVIALSSDPDGDSRKMAMLIQKDPVLTAEILRVANSAALRGAADISTLPQAISRMGLNRVGDIALALALRSGVFNAVGYEQQLNDAWRHSVGAAAWARELARACRSSVDMAYLGGLLHDIGIPLVLSLLNRHRARLNDVELALVLGEVGPTAGVRLVRNWKLPAQIEEIVSACRYDEITDPTCAIVAAAIWVDESDPSIAPKDVAAAAPVQRINLYLEDVEKIFARREQIDSFIGALA